MEENIKGPEALYFPKARRAEAAAVRHNSAYSSDLRSRLRYALDSLQDPDIVLEIDPEGYSKILRELGVYSKINRRAKKVASADWLFQVENSENEEPEEDTSEAMDQDMVVGPAVPAAESDEPSEQDKEEDKLCRIFTKAFNYINDFPKARKLLSRDSTLKGLGLLRIFGKFIDMKMPGDTTKRRWWVPTKLQHVDKQRMRLILGSIRKGTPDRIRWAVQDIFSLVWYFLKPNNPPGLREEDYIWCHYDPEESSLGMGTGLGSPIHHKWWILTHLWIYAADGAERFAQGRMIFKVPRGSGGGADLASQDSNIQSNTTRKQTLITEWESAMARHAFAVDDDQDYEFLQGPEKGHEILTSLIHEIKGELNECIFGDVEGKEIDQDIINEDRDAIESAINQYLKRAFILNNGPNFEAMGYDLEELQGLIFFRIRRELSSDPEAMGRVLLQATALGMPLDADEAYDKLGLTRPPGVPDVILVAPPGAPKAADNPDEEGNMGDVVRAGAAGGTAATVAGGHNQKPKEKPGPKEGQQ